MGFTKNNHLSLCIHYTNALTAVIIFILMSKYIGVYEGFHPDTSMCHANISQVFPLVISESLKIPNGRLTN